MSAALVIERRKVAPSAIRDALLSLWRECGNEDDIVSVSRSLLTNLVAVVPVEREAEMRTLFESLSERVPCRAFLIAVESGSGAITTEVHGKARHHGTTCDLMLEQIEVRVPEGSFARIAGLVRPLLINDLPTRCYWACPWPQDVRRFDGLASMAELSIVDSSRFLMPATELDAIESRRRRGMHITDLNWLRLRPWRRALAEVFERIRYRENAATNVTVRYGEQAMASAALLGRWLEKRLAAHVVVEQDPQKGETLSGIELRHGEDTATLRLVEMNRIEVAVETEAACFLPLHVPTSRGSEGDLLAAAIDLA